VGVEVEAIVVVVAVTVAVVEVTVAVVEVTMTRSAQDILLAKTAMPSRVVVGVRVEMELALKEAFQDPLEIRCVLRGLSEPATTTLSVAATLLPISLVALAKHSAAAQMALRSTVDTARLSMASLASMVLLTVP